MDNNQSPWQRYSGHLVLLLIAILLAVASKTEAVSELLDFESEGEPEAVALVWQADPLAPTVAETGVVTDTEEIAAFDPSSVPVLSDNSLAPVLMPITYKPAQPHHELITYTVQSGDTAIRIAERFGIQEETILGGNAFLSNDAGQLMTGTTIVILPVDGVLHDVVVGETLESISELYGIPVEEIIAYEPNNLEFPYRLHPGTQILVPGAIREVFVWDPPQLVNTSSPEAGQGITVLVPGTGTFVWPTAGRVITQYSWYGHTAIDVSLPTGSPIYASDTGTVTYATWSPYCYGNLVVINHGNGYETFYAHLNGFNVTPGQTVYQGNVIAYSGNTGCSSGPHLHFEIRFNKARYNPLSYLP